MSLSPSRTVRPTRFHELGFERITPTLWRLVTTEDLANVGPLYRTKSELLADLERYASFYGCDGAVVWVPSCD